MMSQMDDDIVTSEMEQFLEVVTPAQFILHCILIPYYATVGLVYAIVSVAAGYSHDKERVADRLSMFFWGDYEKISEEVARNLNGKSEAIRCKDFWDNFLFYMKNSHVILAIFTCADSHPYAPFKRIGVFSFITIYSYSMGIVKEDCFHEINPFISFLYDLLIITLPTILIQQVLLYMAVWYAHSNVTSELEKRRNQRYKKLMESLQLSRLTLSTSYASRDFAPLSKFLWIEKLKWLLRAIYQIVSVIVKGQLKFMKLGEKEYVSTYVGGICWEISIIGLYFAVQYDSGGAWKSFLFGLLLNICLLSFVNDFLYFRFLWSIQHPSDPFNPLHAYLLSGYQFFMFRFYPNNCIDESEEELKVLFQHLMSKELNEITFCSFVEGMKENLGMDPDKHRIKLFITNILAGKDYVNLEEEDYSVTQYSAGYTAEFHERHDTRYAAGHASIYADDRRRNNNGNYADSFFGGYDDGYSNYDVAEDGKQFVDGCFEEYGEGFSCNGGDYSSEYEEGDGCSIGRHSEKFVDGYPEGYSDEGNQKNLGSHYSSFDSRYATGYTDRYSKRKENGQSASPDEEFARGYSQISDGKHGKKEQVVSTKTIPWESFREELYERYKATNWYVRPATNPKESPKILFDIEMPYNSPIHMLRENF